MTRFRTTGRPSPQVVALLVAGAIVLASVPAWAGMDLEIDLGATQAALSSSGQPWAIGPNVGLGARVGVGERWSLRLGVNWRRLWDDTKSDHSVKFPHPDQRAARAWTQAALSLQVLRTIGGPRWSPYLGGGLGWSSWRVEQYPGYHPISVDNGDGVLVDYQADEVVCTFSGGVAPRLFGGTRLRAQLGVDLFTGLGADFDREVNNERSRAQVTFAIGLSFPLRGGGSRVRAAAASSAVRAGETATPGLAPGKGSPSIRPGDTDGDGVQDAFDNCPRTPAGAVVDRVGCPLDGDGDGVYDGLDRCPGTSFAERHRVDSTGCLPVPVDTVPITSAPVDTVRAGSAPVDTAAPATAVPAPVDTTSPATAAPAPVDTASMATSSPPIPPPVVADADSDGVADSLDHCPGTPRKMEIDSTGCLTMTQLDRRLILHVAYISGGTELDPTSARVMNDLAIRLRAAPDVRATVEGFTDDIGDAEANLRLSQKRADKAKAYLVARGIAAKRITALGRGEIAPIADNATALGRRTNRRLEIAFQRGQ